MFWLALYTGDQFVDGATNATANKFASGANDTAKELKLRNISVNL
jgi:hypothetical protein